MISSTDQSGLTLRPPSSPWVPVNRLPTPAPSFFAHKRLAILVFCLVSFFGLAATVVFVGRDYVAQATIRVSPVVPAALDGEVGRFNSGGDYRDFVQQQVFEIDSYATISAALDSLGPRRSLWQAPDESDRRAAERLMAALKVEPIRDTYLIEIELAGDEPDGLADIVNAVAKTYLSRAAKRELDGTDVGVQLLTSRQSELQKKIAYDQQQLAGLTQELGVSNVEAGAINPYDKMLADTNTAFAVASRNVLLAQAHLEAVKAHRARIKNDDVEAKADQVAVTAAENTAAKQQLIQQREQAQFQLSGLGPNHPGRMALEAEIATANTEIGKLDQAAMDHARTLMSDSEQATTSVEISQAQSSLEQTQAAERGIAKELETVKATAATFGAKFSAAEDVNTRLKGELKDLQDLQDRTSMLRLKTQAPGVVALESAAMFPDMAKSKRRMVFALFVLAAMMMAVAVPTVVDLIDQKVKTAGELEAILGFPPLGLALGGNGIHGQETLRRIALGIMREWRTSGIRSYVLTSVREGSNVSLSLALAEELNELGVRTLAIEVSLATPSPRQLRPPAPAPNAANGSGRGTKRLVPRGANTVAFNGSGQSPAQFNGDTSLQRAQNGVARSFGHVRETVDRFLGNHDIVLLAGAPLLASADTVAMIQMPAGAILVARAERDDVSDIATAVRELERCVPPVVGAVFCDRSWPEGVVEHDLESEVEHDRRPSSNQASYGLVGK